MKSEVDENQLTIENKENIFIEGRGIKDLRLYIEWQREMCHTMWTDGRFSFSLRQIEDSQVMNRKERFFESW